MNKLTTALAAILVLGSASVALADDPAIDLGADALRSYGPLINQPAPLVGRNVALSHNVQVASDSWMDRASKSYDGGGY
jgi:hypothetical protein